MNSKDIPMIPDRKKGLPLVYGDTPTFLGCESVDLNNIKQPIDLIFSGVPWEGTITWGTYSGCELAPKTIRHASARYGGFLPEYEINIFDHLTLGDIGDCLVNPNNVEETMNNVYLLSCLYNKGHPQKGNGHGDGRGDQNRPEGDAAFVCYHLQ